MRLTKYLPTVFDQLVKQKQSHNFTFHIYHPIYTPALMAILHQWPPQISNTKPNHKQINTTMWYLALSFVSLLLSTNIQGGSAEQCGSQAGGVACPGGLCCSQWGWCGTTPDYCNNGCQSQCSGGGGGGGGSGSSGIGDLISEDIFNEMLKHRNDGVCPAQGFYTYDAFLEAAEAFPNFATTGDTATRKREIAAFLGQTSHETTGGWASAPDGPYSWGYCFIVEQNPGYYCDWNPNYPCAAGKQYYGRGPIQLSWNYNYGQCGEAIGVNLLENPDLVATDPVLSFTTALWFWMTPQSPKPSCHDVITGEWNPSGDDQSAGRVSGYGLITNIINGGLECGMGPNAKVESRIGFYKRYCDLLGIGYGDNLDCYNQKPFGFALNAGYSSAASKESM